ncbi:MAG: PLP-dependent aspartate aminotransferase family protein [Burkholderiaceae bacterium]
MRRIDDPGEGPGRSRRIETVLAQGTGAIYGPYAEVVEPIHMSTTYERAADNSYPGGATYSRDGNPAYRAPESLLCALEGGSDALVFSSGMSAATAVFQTLRPGMRVVAPQNMYWSLRQWLISFCRQWDIRLELFEAAGEKPADSCATGNLAALLAQPLDLLWLESPANPTWEITDIACAAALAKQSGALVCVDSTVATPVFSQPLSLGADIVMHSATKYLNGHSDVLAGALITGADSVSWQQVKMSRASVGSVPGPFESWLLARGMRTLFPRVRLAAASAATIAAYFSGHRALKSVLYPGLESHQGHTVAARQMHGGFGAMLSLRFAGGADAAVQCAAAVKVFKRATSLGSTESLLEHRASIEGPGSFCPDDLLRLSIGIEHIDDLIADLEQAMSRLPSAPLHVD